MHAGGVLGIETTKLLEASTGADFEPLQARVDAMLDGRVITDIEMEKRLILDGAPVSSVHGRMISDIKSSGDNLAVAFGQHQTNMARKISMQLVEELLREILAAVIKSIDVAFVKTKHGAHVLFA